MSERVERADETVSDDNLFGVRMHGPSVVAIGTFDGVHLGHQHLVTTVIDRARARHARAVVVTFDPPPRMVLRPDQSYRLLTGLDERAELLRALGIDRLLTIHFDRSVAEMSAERFVDELVDRLGLVELIGGPDLALGHRRAGTPPVLARLGSERGFDVRLVEPLLIAGEPVRSGRIRDLLREGAVEAAAHLLGRPPTLRGAVLRSADHADRGCSFDLRVDPSRLLPAGAVYAARLGTGRDGGAAVVMVPPSSAASSVPGSATSVPEQPTIVSIWHDGGRPPTEDQVQVSLLGRVRDFDPADPVPLHADWDAARSHGA